MKKTLDFVFAVLLLSLFCLAPMQANAEQGGYLDPQTLSPLLLPPPPQSGSTEERQQIMGVLAVQKHIAKSDLVALRNEQHVHIELMTDVLGSNFTRQQNPKAFDLLDKVIRDTRTISENAKNYWGTKRPYLVDHRVHLLVDPIDQSPAYPSGHTCFARVVAEVLGVIVPSRLADLRARADAIAQHRIMAGVHHPVDIDGGRLLAMQIVGALMQNSDFRDDLAAAKAEAAEAK